MEALVAALDPGGIKIAAALSGVLAHSAAQYRIAAPQFRIEHIANAGGLLRRGDDAAAIQRHLESNSRAIASGPPQVARLLTGPRVWSLLPGQTRQSGTIRRPVSPFVVAPWWLALSMRGREILDRIIQAPAYWAIHGDLYPKAQIP